MSKPNKKQRHEAKRKAKKLALRRKEAISPVKRLVDAPGDVECWMSDRFELFGQTQLFVYKNAAGLSGMACFLIDRGVVGLKDAYVRMQVDRSMFDEMLELAKSQDMTMFRCNRDLARQWVAGGLRWAHDNGMRLPKDWMRAASFIGGLGDWHQADVSKFVMEFAGHPDDLRQRLTRESFERYIQRDDIDFVFSDDAPYMDQRTGEYLNNDEFDDEDFEFDEEIEKGIAKLERHLNSAAELATEETTKWLALQGQTPSPRLDKTWRDTLMATLSTTMLQPRADQESFLDSVESSLETIGDRLDDAEREEFDKAMDQVERYSVAEPEVFERAYKRFFAPDDIINPDDIIDPVPTNSTLES